MGYQISVGNTSSALALATMIAIEHNLKVLLISTSLNDTLIKDSFWVKPKTGKLASIFSSNKNVLDGSGIGGLNRMIKSNKLSSEIISQYTKVVLTNRLEVLLGFEGTEEQYNEMTNKYPKIIMMANEAYDIVIVDLDRKIGPEAEINTLKISNAIVAMVSQRESQILEILDLIKRGDLLKEEKTILTIGKYINSTKYNAKNISRSILKSKQIINLIPYNNQFFEASQEGNVVDLFLKLMRMNDKNDKNEFIYELKRLYETIKTKVNIKTI